MFNGEKFEGVIWKHIAMDKRKRKKTQTWYTKL